MEKPYIPNPSRYDHATFRRCGRSGIVLPPISLGLWQNFGGADVFETGRAMIRRAFDRGVTHFDLANNYRPPFGSAEINFCEILRTDDPAEFETGFRLTGQKRCLVFQFSVANQAL